MSKDGYEIDGGWVATAIILGVCLSMGPAGWIIGAFILRKKLKQFRRGRNERQQFNKIGTSLLAAGIGMMVFGLTMFGLPVAVAGGVVLWYAHRASERERRYKKYMAIIGGRDYMPIADIARAVQVPVDQTRSELQNMIDLGYFGLNTYIDLRTMCIVIDSRASQSSEYRKQPIYVDPEPERSYEQERQQREREEAERRAAVQEAARRAAEEAQQEAQREAQKQAEKQAAAEKQKAAQEQESPTEESDQFGHWILAIREVNDRIDDQVISDKIDRIEMLTRRIFETVRTRPEKEGQIRKFMNYYLPTTLKLLDSYALLEAQGIEGENITAAKQKIEGIMDTLIQGFEKQLDLLFSAQALDINSDIQVLESMMAADGLKDNAFKLRKSGSAGK